MKKLFTYLAIIMIVCTALGFASGPTESKDWKALPSGGFDTMLVGTSAVLDTTGAISLQDKHYLAFQLDLTLASGGSSGGGYLYIEGRVSDGNWVKLPLVDLSDSCSVVYNAAFSGTASLSKYVIVGGVVPFGLDTSDLVGTVKAGGALTSSVLWGDFMPFDKVRAITSDTDWNAVVTVSGTWLYW